MLFIAKPDALEAEHKKSYTFSKKQLLRIGLQTTLNYYALSFY
jgi:hypothetical protein